MHRVTLLAPFLVTACALADPTGPMVEIDGGASQADAAPPSMIGTPPEPPTADAGVDSGVAPSPPSPVDPPASDLPPVDDYGATGPWDVTREVGGPDGAYTIYRPTDLGRDGFAHPSITWGNGTGAPVSVYDSLLRHLASHGFVVIASHSTRTGSGEEMLRGLAWLDEQAERPGPYLGHLDTEAFGATGHSQGGGGTINAGGDPGVRCVAPIQPAPGEVRSLHGEMFLMAGSADTIVSASRLVRPLSYEPSPVPTVYGVLQGATHFTPVGMGGGYRAPLTAWFRYCLMGDAVAETWFFGDRCELCEDAAWAVERKNLDLRGE